ncbi:hypothetical protein AYL99_00002 [Fonsecaea erecta]|uniref:NADP-dependent oxidoreductase domain-containing protein n=1 Tax=Fonsecaea erecta TaxID=1367422 RepID=A0A178ZW54_9EURO|nr:hypothetical protein AYL99_00002 [Fonsecaea erecta]OAP64030.1 hypothetical protein AYL99_00002 [Fonsecaea erecta]
MATGSPTLVFGGGSIGLEASGGSFSLVEDVEELLSILQMEGIEQIDTAQLYSTSEQLLGQARAGERFLIDTKHIGGWAPGNSSRAQVVERGMKSLRTLGIEKANIFYLHAPDPTASIEDTLAGVNDLYVAGKFARFGLSNFTAEQVKDAILIAKDKNYVVPTVYQGNYNVVSRRIETELFPVLREHGMSFYAYSPIAAGFLTKTRELLTQASGGQGRWRPDTQFGQLYLSMYNKPKMLEALDLWNEISESSKIPRAELAYRWIAFHSLLDEKQGDAIVLGASTTKQLKSTLIGLRHGPLPRSVQERIAEVWEIAKGESVLDSYEGYKLK